MRPLGAFVLVFLEAHLNSTCISHNSLLIFSMKQCIKQYWNNQGLRSGLGWLHLPHPWLFRISQKPHPIIVYYLVFVMKCKCGITKEHGAQKVRNVHHRKCYFLTIQLSNSFPRKIKSNCKNCWIQDSKTNLSRVKYRENVNKCFVQTRQKTKQPRDP